MAWKGIRKGNFKNYATELVSGWKVGDLLHIDVESPYYCEEWRELTKIGIVKAIDTKTRHTPPYNYYRHYNIMNKADSYYPTYKSNGKYKQILIQFGNVEHTLNINDNAESRNPYPPLISPRDAEIKTKQRIKDELKGLEFGRNLHTSLLAFERLLVAERFQSRDNISLSQLQGDRSDSLAVFNEGFDISGLGESMRLSHIDGLPYMSDDGMISLRSVIFFAVSDFVEPHLPARGDEESKHPFMKHLCGSCEDELVEIFERHGMIDNRFPIPHDWFWADNGKTSTSLNIKRSWAITDEGLQLTKMRLFTSEKNTGHWEPIGSHRLWSFNEPIEVLYESEQHHDEPFNRDYLRIGGEWIPQDKE